MIPKIRNILAVFLLFASIFSCNNETNKMSSSDSILAKVKAEKEQIYPTPTCLQINSSYPCWVGVDNPFTVTTYGLNKKNTK